MPALKPAKRSAPQKPQPRVRPEVAPRWMEPAACFSFLAFALWMSAEIFQGAPPFIWDHHTHYGRAWYMIHNLIPNFTLWNWNDAWLAGYPVNYNYAFFADIVVALIHGLTLTLAPLGFAYSVAVIGTHFIEGYSLYWLGKQMGLPWAGWVGGLIFATHLGGGLVGGWHWLHFAGVWPVSLAVAFGLFHYGLVHRMLEAPSRRRAAVAGLVLGVALLTHPLMLVYALMMAAWMPLSVLLLEKNERAERWKALAWKFTVAFFIGALWLLPFFSAKPFAENYWDPGDPLPLLAKRAWEGELFEGLWPIFGLASFVGILGFAVSKVPSRFVAAGFTFLLLTTGTSSFFQFADLGRISEAFYHVQMHRFHMLAKPFWCLAGGMVLVSAFRYLARLQPIEAWKRASVPHRLLMAIPLALCLVLVAPGLGPSLAQYTFKKFGPLRAEDSPAERKQAVAWLQEKEKADDRFWRVASAEGDGDYKDLIAELRSPIYDWGSYLPAVNFKDGPNQKDDETIQLLSVRYLIFKNRSPVEDDARFSEVARFGPYAIAEYKGWNWRTASLIGKGQVTQRLREPNHAVLDVEMGTTGRVLLHKSYFDRWQATWNGVPVRVQPHKVAKLDLIAVDLPDDTGGTLDFRFVVGMPEKTGIAWFLVGCGLFVYLYFGARSRKARLRALR